MKEVGFEHWHSPNTGATNESGFTALPAGFRREMYVNGEPRFIFGFIEWSTHYWSITRNNNYYVWSLSLYCGDERAGMFQEWDLYTGSSVRCIKD